MPKRSSANVSLNSRPTLGFTLFSPVDSLPDAEPASCRPGLSNGFGYLMLTVAPIDPLDRLASGVFKTSTWPTKSDPTDPKSKPRVVLPIAVGTWRPSNRVSLNCGPNPRTVICVDPPPDEVPPVPVNETA